MSMRNAEQLLAVALQMAQELQEFVDDAIEDSDDEKALASTQALLEDWNNTYKEYAQ